MQFYSQIDPRWGGILLGHNTDPNFNLANYGCLVTAWGNLLVASTGEESWTPARVNQWAKDNDGFLPGGGTFVWSAALRMGGVTGSGSTADMKAVQTFLQADPNFAVLEVRAGNRQHFVLSPYVGKIVDSQDGKVKPVNTYPFVSAHLYTAVALPIPVVAAPATSGDLNATVTIRVPLLNARTQPNTSSQTVAQFHAGTAHTTGWTVGETVTVGGRTDNVWLRSDNNHWFAQAGTNANYGHLPANLSPFQSAHLVASHATGGALKAINKFRGIRK